MEMFKIWNNGSTYAVDGKAADADLIKAVWDFATKRGDYTVRRCETAENNDVLLKAFLNNMQNC